MDLVVWQDRILVFVEVKTRRGVGFGHPLDAITPAKRKEVARAARGWMGDANLPPVTTIRFDAVSVLWTGGGPPEIQHIPDAWRLG
jgi:putative endonuclease